MKKHWYKDMHYAEFAEDESQALLSAIKEYENNKWKTIGQKVGKPAKVRATRTDVQPTPGAPLIFVPAGLRAVREGAFSW